MLLEKNLIVDLFSILCKTFVKASMSIFNTSLGQLELDSILEFLLKFSRMILQSSPNMS